MISLPIDILDKLSMGLILLNQKQEILLWNHWMENKTQFDAKSVFGKAFSEVCPRFQETKYRKIIETVIKTGEGRFLSGALHGSFFHHFSSDSYILPTIQNLQIEQIVFEDHCLILIQVNDITSQYHTVHQMKSFIKSLEIENEEIRQAELEARKLAVHDALTGLPNRTNFMNHLTKMIRTQHNSFNGAAVIFLDIDNFKIVNDSYGHSVGDALLQIAAERLKASIRKSDVVARLSGDEFALLIYNVNSRNSIISVANKIMAQFSSPFTINGLQLSVTCSFGISIYPFDGADAVTLLHQADTALYRVKNDKKADYQFYCPYEHDDDLKLNKMGAADTITIK